MFEWVKWPILLNLSLIYIIMMIREKKLETLSTKISPTATKWSNLALKNHISVQVLRMLKMSCASELNDDDL